MEIQRNLLRLISASLIPGKVIVLHGPRQVGKTTLVRKFMDLTSYRTHFVNADELLYREILSSQNLQQLRQMIGDAELLIIDEAQRITDIGLNLKLIVDNYPDLRVIATGSASFELANQISEPLTGRKLTYTLFPVSYDELDKSFGSIIARNQLERWLIWGGYPEIVCTEDLSLREKLMGELVSSYL